MKKKATNRKVLHKALPLGFAHELPKDDKRIPGLLRQQKKYGYDATELWSLDITIAKFILPRLKSFAEIQGSVPGYFVNDDKRSCDDGIKEWARILASMIAAFELLAADDNWVDSWKKTEVVRLGLHNFQRFFTSLWI